MPKRSALEKIEYYSNKIRRIEEKQRRRRIIISPQQSSEDEENDVSQSEQIHDLTAIDHSGEQDANSAIIESKDSPIHLEEQQNDINQEEQISAVQDHEPLSTDIAIASTSSAALTNEPELDPELLSALGESMSDTPEYGENIHSNLTKLWIPLLKRGIPKDNKERLTKEYLIPDNCRLLQSPKLNAEISAAIPDMVRNRDKTLSASQQELGQGITAINRGMDVLLKQNDKIEAMKHISNGCRILCDLHYLMTQNRIKLVTPSLDKTFLHTINDSERDDTLFGSSLSEKIKAAKAIEKQGLQIKNKPVKNQKQLPASTNNRSSSNQGNWSAPPRYSANRGGRSGYKKQFASTPVAPTRRPYSAQQTRPTASQDKSRAPAHR